MLRLLNLPDSDPSLKMMMRTRTEVAIEEVEEEAVEAEVETEVEIEVELEAEVAPEEMLTETSFQVVISQEKESLSLESQEKKDTQWTNNLA